MAEKAVFMDRDGTIIEDPGYLADLDAVKLLPGVELAIKSLAQAGYKLVVVTNQSGIARGMLTEEQLERIHGEMRRQLGEHNAHIDGIYYCPYHPEGTVEGYAVDSPLRKPEPGMLLKAAGDLGIDLSESWMVGDSPRDIDAGQRAGCRTIRVRTPGAAGREDQDEDVHADFTVRNLVDAARVIMREATRRREEAPVAGPSRPSGASARATTTAAKLTPPEEAAEPLSPVPPPAEVSPPGPPLSVLRVVAMAVQMLALAALAVAVVRFVRRQPMDETQLWATLAVMLQLLVLSLLHFSRRR